MNISAFTVLVRSFMIIFFLLSFSVKAQTGLPATNATSDAWGMYGYTKIKNGNLEYEPTAILFENKTIYISTSNKMTGSHSIYAGENGQWQLLGSPGRSNRRTYGTLRFAADEFPRRACQ